MAKDLSSTLGLDISRSKLRRFLKKLGYCWKRFKKSLHKLQDVESYNTKLRELKKLIDLEKDSHIDIFYADATGFNQKGYVPYGWQPANEYIHITPERGKTLQIFGFMSKDNRLEAYSCNGTLNSAMVIAFIDDFVQTLTQKTYVIIDNATIHHSIEFHCKIEEWEKLNLFIFYLPKYSPHLNLIEILWRRLKYQWIEYENIDSFQELEQQVINILNGFGDTFNIQFNSEILAKEKMSLIFD